MLSAVKTSGRAQSAAPDASLTSRRAVGWRLPPLAPRDVAAPTPKPARAETDAAKVFLQTLNPKKIIVSWHLPSTLERNCREIFSGKANDFVLRVYRAETALEVKPATRALEFVIDASRRCCYLNLDHARGNFIAELGFRCRGGRYIFIARSNEMSLQPTTARANPAAPKSSRGAAPRRFAKPAEFISAPEMIELTAENSIEWAERDILAEDQTAAVYLDFTREGTRLLRHRSAIAPTAKNLRRSALTSRRQRPAPIKISAPIDAAPAPVAEITAPRPTYVPCEYPLLVIDEKPRQAVATVGKILAEKTAEKKTRRVKSESLSATLKQIRDDAEIVLRGKVKRAGQRVRVGGLLIEPAADGTFCVACKIVNGKLLVPVAEVAAEMVK
jgi:hypothetical protein